MTAVSGIVAYSSATRHASTCLCRPSATT